MPPADPLPTDTLALLVGVQRERSGYRTLLQYVDVERELAATAQQNREIAADWQAGKREAGTQPDVHSALAATDSALSALSEAETATLAHARRMAGVAPRDHRAALADALVVHARQEIQQRPLRAAQKLLARRVLPAPPTLALDIPPAVVTHLQRQEHNLIARALVFPTPAPAIHGLGQDADPLTQTLIEAHGQMLSAQRLCVRYTLAGQPTLAQHYAQQAEAGEHDYLAAHATITRERRSSLRGRHYQDGDTFTLTLPDGGGDHLFHLDLYWNDQGLGLTVDAQEAGTIERLTGIRVGQGWASLCAWVLHTHQRMVEAEGAGRRPDDDAELVWRWRDELRLQLRPEIETRYPGLIAALEALRCSLVAI